MDFQVLNEMGSFKAWSIGLQYEYDIESRILDISETRLGRPTIYIYIEIKNADKARSFVSILDKIVQLYALNISNNTSLDITELVDNTRLKAIMKNISTIASRAYHLTYYQFNHFKDLTNKESIKHQLCICGAKSCSSNNEKYFIGCLLKKCGTTEEKLMGKALPEILSQLAHELTTAVLTDKKNHNNMDEIQVNIRIANELKILSAALNEKICPMKILKNNNLDYVKSLA